MHAVLDASTLQLQDVRSQRVVLLKLHGSTDLFEIDGMIRRKIHTDEIGQELVYYPVEFSGYRHIIESPYLELFSSFKDKINRDNTWIIIGSSLRDRTICSIMNDVIRLKPERQRPKIVYVNPNEDAVKNLKDWRFLQERISPNHIKEYFGSNETNTKIESKLRSD